MSTHILVRNLTGARRLTVKWLSGKDQPSLYISKNSTAMRFLKNSLATQIMNKLVILMCFRDQIARKIIRLRLRKRHSHSYNFDLISTQKVSQEGSWVGFEF